MRPAAGLDVAVKLTAEVANSSLLAAAATIVSVCVTASVFGACAERTGLPAFVSLYWNVAVLLALAIVTVVIGEPPGLLRKVPPDDEVPRFTVRPPTPALTELP